MSEQHTIKTKFGTVTATLTDANHAFVSTLPQEGITVNQVAYYVNCHLYRWSTGEWRIGQESESNEYIRQQSLYLTRKDWINVKDMHASRSAFKKAAVELTQAFVDFIRGNPQVAVNAQCKHLNEALEAAEAKYTEALTAAEEALKVRDLALLALRNFVAQQ